MSVLMAAGVVAALLIEPQGSLGNVTHEAWLAWWYLLVFGTLTLLLQDDTFIKMKPTIVNSLFAVTLLGGLVFGKSLLKYVFGEVYKLKPEGWRKLTLNWGLFFVFLAVSNEVVWRLFDTDTWVAFKVWAIMPITVVFSMLQLPLLNRYALDPKSPVEAVPPMDPLP